MTKCSAPALSLTVGTTNRITTSGYAYDAAGNMTTVAGISGSLVYNAENQMTSAAGVTYFYDGDGRRVKKSNGTLYWYGLGGEVLQETSLSGVLLDEYIFFNGQRTARRAAAGTVYYFFSDHLGSARVVTNATGGIVEESDFYPFGGERIITDTLNNNYKFTGKERDPESGLDNFGFRYNSSSLGRFMSPDPFAGSGRVENPQTWNRYAYALNNPLRYTDPLGLFASPAYNCSEGNDACLNDAQRQILENSRVEIDGQKLSGEALYSKLNETQQNAFVNVTDRLASITFSDGSTALSAVQSISSFQEDRVFANVNTSLAENIAKDSRFGEVGFIKSQHPGTVISFKSDDAKGNIQFSFDKSRTVADIDHDLCKGLCHVFEAARNHATNSRTDQDEVRRILVANPKVGITPSPDPKFNRPQ